MSDIVEKFTVPVETSVGESAPPTTGQDVPYQLGNMPGATTARRFKGVWANQMKPILTRRDLIKGLVPKNALTVVWGPPSCGKSFLTLDAAIHIATNRMYQGRRTVQGQIGRASCRERV